MNLSSHTDFICLLILFGVSLSQYINSLKKPHEFIPYFKGLGKTNLLPQNRPLLGNQAGNGTPSKFKIKREENL